jgi:quercetin dioxygenase-like cupin family protein
VHTHPGPELIYTLSGEIDYQNGLVGSKRLGPGALEGIPPGVPVQKRNPSDREATFLSWFLVDPKKPFAPRAEF